MPKTSKTRKTRFKTEFASCATKRECDVMFSRLLRRSRFSGLERAAKINNQYLQRCWEIREKERKDQEREECEELEEL